MYKVLFVFLFGFIAISCKKVDKLNKPDPDSALTIPEMIAYAHGYENWEDITSLKFTFNVERGTNTVQRTWIWKPKTDDVVYINKKDTLQYNRRSMDSIALKADRGFINDKFWLLSPFQMVWDTGTHFNYADSDKTPMGNEDAHKIILIYGDEGGYTPGDAYDFYFGSDFLIKEWSYRKGNSPLPTLSTTWKDYQNFGGLKLATRHENEDGTMKLYFTNIEVEKE